MAQTGPGQVSTLNEFKDGDNTMRSNMEDLLQQDPGNLALAAAKDAAMTFLG